MSDRADAQKKSFVESWGDVPVVGTVVKAYKSAVNVISGSNKSSPAKPAGDFGRSLFAPGEDLALGVGSKIDEELDEKDVTDRQQDYFITGPVAGTAANTASAQARRPYAQPRVGADLRVVRLDASPNLSFIQNRE